VFSVKNKRTVCSPSPVVLTKRSKSACEFLVPAAYCSIVMVDRSSSKVAPFPFFNRTLRDNNRAVRLAHALARPDCVEYNIRQASNLLRWSFSSLGVSVAVASVGASPGKLEVVSREDDSVFMIGNGWVPKHVDALTLILTTQHYYCKNEMTLWLFVGFIVSFFSSLGNYSYEYRNEYRTVYRKRESS
jgi:hypothetical protein